MYVPVSMIVLAWILYLATAYYRQKGEEEHQERKRRRKKEKPKRYRPSKLPPNLL